MFRPSKASIFSGGVQPPSLWSESSPDECEETCRHGKPHWGVVGALQDSSICFPFLVSRFAIPKAQSGCFKWLAYVGMLAPFPGFLGWYRHHARWWHYMLRRKGILNLNQIVCHVFCEGGQPKVYVMFILISLRTSKYSKSFKTCGLIQSGICYMDVKNKIPRKYIRNVCPSKGIQSYRLSSQNMDVS